MAAYLWGHVWVSKRVEFRCHNMALVSVLCLGTSRDPNIMLLLCHLLIIAACQSFVFTACFYCQPGGTISLLTCYLILIFSAFVVLHHRLSLGQLQYLHHCWPSFHGLTEKCQFTWQMVWPHPLDRFMPLPSVNFWNFATRMYLSVRVSLPCWLHASTKVYQQFAPYTLTIASLTHSLIVFNYSISFVGLNAPRVPTWLSASRWQQISRLFYTGLWSSQIVTTSCYGLPAVLASLASSEVVNL